MFALQEPRLIAMDVVGAVGSGRQAFCFIVAWYDDCCQLDRYPLAHILLIKMYNATASLLTLHPAPKPLPKLLCFNWTSYVYEDWLPRREIAICASVTLHEGVPMQGNALARNARPEIGVGKCCSATPYRAASESPVLRRLPRQRVARR